MDNTELAVLTALAIVLVASAVFFGLRQLRALRTLGGRTDLSALDRQYQRRQSQRRLVCSVLMLVFAGFLVGWYFLQQELDAIKNEDGQIPADHPLVKTFTYYWIAALFVLFGLLSLASFDMIATARYAFRQSRELEHQRRAELEEELAQYRRRRAEMN